MKNILLLTLIGFLLNCDNKKIGVPQLPNCGNFMALKNKQEWSASPSATFFNRDSINLMVEECGSFRTHGEVQWLSINQLPIRTGRYPLQATRWDALNGTPLSVWLYTRIGENTTGIRYNLYHAAPEANEITIDKYNPKTRQLDGHLNATFVIDPESAAPGQSQTDTIRIQDAIFSVVVNGAI
ncbi:hypothetical protein LX87_00729 [Larkinella arboricola]|uniref:Uncharacterized protein n=1 Tax=Larkinella arboricola TaxID=643671 RepID=A0A327X7H7_LARAB|nr:hypothetical protein [Larkinella arboricola]RAK02609.1 hypothetical protein LX87_00729 [Larkinella arboricola]